ncbi:MAG: M1 family metallopeptidase [Candidatus Paceibacterota bacterium]|jgi:puromycin-sensitive aminopeptidase
MKKVKKTKVKVAKKKEKEVSALLPAHIIPNRYKIVLRPDLEKCVFDAEENIYLKITKPSKRVELHSLDLNIKSAEFVFGKKSVKANKISYDTKRETVILDFEKAVSGKTELAIKFCGPISNKMCGFYRSNYSVNGEEKILATTQFESTDARRAFVCVDEPAAKAIFDITLIVPADKTVISNTHILDVAEHEGGYKVVKFAPTPKMSTYLVAFIVGDFEYVEKKNDDGVLVRVFVTPGKKKQAGFALDVACKCLSFYNKYFKIKYPLAVLDMIAIPDFAAGAMENWGAVTYRETALLVDPEHSAAAARQRVAIVVAHELAHQWFGNLTTMEWWTHLWLNEGFATWIEYLAVDHIFPEWDMWTQFAYADYGRALDLDSLKTTHPIEVKVKHSHEINQIFDAVSYSKGASVIRMLADYLGEKDFRQGLYLYLTKHKYANASTEDLWRAFEKASGKPVGKIMKCWTSQLGYPLLAVSENKGKLVVGQKRFYSSGLEAEANKKSKDTWKIPVGFNSSAISGRKYIVLDKKTGVLPLKYPVNGWINANVNRSGFYRVGYSGKMIEDIKPAIVSKKIGAIDRLGILNDTFSLFRSGLIDGATAMGLLGSYKNETDYTVWCDLATWLDNMDNILWGEKSYEQYKKFAASLFDGIVAKVGWSKKDTDTHSDSLMRGLILVQAGKYGNKEVIEKAQLLFADYVKNGKHLDPDIRAAVYSLVAQNGGEDEYAKLMKLYDEATLQEERNRLASALCRFKQSSLIDKALRFILSDKVRNQDKPIVIAAVAANNFGHDATWKFLKDNWGDFFQRYKDGHHLLGRIISSVVNDFKTEKMAQDVEKFFSKNKAHGAERAIDQALELIRARAFWFKHAEKSVANFLKEFCK